MQLRFMSIDLAFKDISKGNFQPFLVIFPAILQLKSRLDNWEMEFI